MIKQRTVYVVRVFRQDLSIARKLYFSSNRFYLIRRVINLNPLKSVSIEKVKLTQFTETTEDLIYCY